MERSPLAIYVDTIVSDVPSGGKLPVALRVEILRTSAKFRVKGRTRLGCILVREIGGVNRREKLGLISLGARQSALKGQSFGRNTRRANRRRRSLLCRPERARNLI